MSECSKHPGSISGMCPYCQIDQLSRDLEAAQAEAECGDARWGVMAPNGEITETSHYPPPPLTYWQEKRGYRIVRVRVTEIPGGGRG